MKGVWFVVFCLAPLSLAAAAEESLRYTFSPDRSGDRLAFRVDMRFRGDPSGATTLILPSHWAGQEQLHAGIHDLEVTGGTLHETGAPDRRRIEHPSGRPLRVRYRFVQDRPVDFSDHHRTHRPILDTAYFHFVGHGGFVHPDWNSEVTRPIEIRWKRMPAGWTLANSFGAGATRQRFDAALDELLHAIYVGGDFRLGAIDLDGYEVAVAIRGAWQFDDGEFFDLVETIIRTERAFWNDSDFPYFLVTLIPTGTRCCSFGGTGLTNSFATFVATDGGLDPRLENLLAHELMHTWIGQKMRNDSGDGRPEALLYWFSEGFTDYFTRELLHRAGRMSDDDYLADANRKIFELYASPVRNEPNRRVADDFWTDRHVQKLPYQRGDLLARVWDAEIRAASDGRASLDDAMRELLHRAETDRSLTTPEGLNAVLRGYLGRDIGTDLRRYIDAGDTIPPPDRALGGRASLRMIEMGPFRLGFDFDASRDAGRVTAVDPEGPAWRAGLRDGQVLKGFGIHWDDPAEPVAIDVEIDGEVKKFEYLPQGKPLPVPQYSRN